MVFVNGEVKVLINLQSPEFHAKGRLIRNDILIGVGFPWSKEGVGFDLAGIVIEKFNPRTEEIFFGIDLVLSKIWALVKIILQFADVQVQQFLFFLGSLVLGIFPQVTKI